MRFNKSGRMLPSGSRVFNNPAISLCGGERLH